ncbi:MOB member 4, phocein [Chytriomyces hyalinus]|nr:MOB member 4, phocein [Chytriomyces hyalinus]KAJ3252371.1 MOB member 4, phocein [Chytriomyces hyalinus]
MVINRNKKGTRLEEWNAWQLKTVDTDSDDKLDDSLAEKLIRRAESSLAVQTVIQHVLAVDNSDIEAIVRLPEGVDPAVWQCEHLRQLCLQLNQLVALLIPECLPSNEDCREMKAGEWQYLCAAHVSPQPCSAIDYIIHTLDGATALLNSSKFFPSRATIPMSSHKHFSSIARRLYRIFAHAWFHHREIFDDFENETCLYKRFLFLSTIEFQLIPEKLITIPQVFDMGV